MVLSLFALSKRAHDFFRYAFMVLIGLFALVVFALRNQIDIAIEVTREAAKALLDMPFMIVFPIVPAMVLGKSSLLGRNAKIISSSRKRKKEERRQNFS